ncbi:MAG: molybdopterin cofactor-binding domain-containing protein [Candidatus Nanopelagicales bacterium]
MTLRKYVAVDDRGVQVNPLIVEGQVHGGLAQGIAQGSTPRALYDADGNLLTGSMGDYLPRARPTCRRSSPTGRSRCPRIRWAPRGSARPALIASTPAIINGIVDALRPWASTTFPRPTTPATWARQINNVMPASPQNVWRAIQNAKGGQA